MKQHFCTLFNSYYLSRGLALYQSLIKQNISFDLYVFCFDDIAYRYLIQKQLPHLIPVSLSELENYFPELLSVKKERSLGEYCWTSTSFTLRYCLEKENVEHCTYFDADMYFYNSPNLIIQERENASVIITPHHYAEEYDQSAMSGIYCVQFMYFENTTSALEVLRWWSGACIEWCYSKAEDGKFGDQKYLDFWPYYFHGIHINRHHGAGMAPWNAKRYQLESRSDSYELVLSETQTRYPLVFFHFHGLKLYSNGAQLTDDQYDLPKEVKEFLYKNYVSLLRQLESEIESEFNDYHSTFSAYSFPGLKTYIRTYVRSLLQSIEGLFSSIFGKAVRMIGRNRI
ncbi:MAG: glycosyl transferase [Cytophagaceae bacterium]|jgi:hypothetical protein|nr:glycosyl transferase [Cytophagaceae bacterium]